MVNDLLTAFFVSSIKQAEAIHPNYAQLWKQLHSLQSSGGKRLRPKLVFLSYSAFHGQRPELIAPVAAAQELLHFSMLIHDDIIDRDTTRYGVPNITGSYENIYGEHVPDSADRTHYANSAAIMAGDLMIAAAHSLITESAVDDSQKIAALKIMYRSMFDVAGGELLDTESSFLPSGSIDPLKIAHFKTASYSFLGPLLTGATLADANDSAKENLTQLAINLGIAYQLTDDLLGVFGDEVKTGKSNTGDVREGKQTYLIEMTRSALSPDQLVKFETHFGNKNASTDDIETIKQMIVKSGARQKTLDLIDSYVKKTRGALHALHIDDASRLQLDELITKAIKRDF